MYLSGTKVMLGETKLKMGLHLVFMCINLYYQMPEQMIGGLNEQLLTLRPLVWSGIQC